MALSAIQVKLSAFAACIATFAMGALASASLYSAEDTGRQLSVKTPLPSEMAQVLGLNRQQEMEFIRDVRLFAPLQLQPLKRHPRSISVVQDTFVAIHRFMFGHGLLPLSAWGMGRGPPVPGRRPSHDNDVVVRAGLVRFFREFAHIIPPHSVCMEWDRLKYAPELVPGCDANASWSFVYDGRVGQGLRMNARKRVLRGELGTLGDGTMVGDATPRFDLIICNQARASHYDHLAPLRFSSAVLYSRLVFEHIQKPREAARGVFNLLKPGGVVLFTAPFLEPFHRVPADYFRYTLDGAAEIFESAGFEILARRKVGNTAIATGLLLGFGVADFEPAYLERNVLTTFERKIERRADQWAFLESCLVLRKPTVAAAKAAAQQQWRQQQRASISKFVKAGRRAKG